MRSTKRTACDWSEHVLIIEKHDTYTIHELKKPDTILHRVRFLNIIDKLIVTGDYGTWVFSRSFVPSVLNYVSDEYWCEKLVEANHNLKFKHFSTEETREQIIDTAAQEIISNFSLPETDLPSLREAILDDSFLNTERTLEQVSSKVSSRDEKKLRKEIQYWADCWYAADDKCEYEIVARDIPSGCSENCIFGEKIDNWLLIIFDAFDEICSRL